MSEQINYGQLNSHVIGRDMKELVRRAIVIIRRQLGQCEALEKAGYGATIVDVYTVADTSAQQEYLRVLREAYPDYGIVAEEGQTGIGQACPELFFTIDPLDGTRAFLRRQSMGVGTMIALVCRGEVIAAYVGDVMTQEIFGFRPEAKKVHRISQYEYSETLTIDTTRPLLEQRLLLNDDPRLFTSTVQKLTYPGRLFKGVECHGGGIGVNLARVWKGEVAGVVLRPSNQTPWDLAPILGISQRLGLSFWEIIPGKELRAFKPKVTAEITATNNEMLIIHDHYFPEIIRSNFDA